MSVDPTAIVHPTAIVESGARIGAGTRIGPYCVIGPEVEIGPDCDLKSHVVVAGITRMGAGNEVFPFASIGHAPQDLKYAGERSTLEIGDRNRIREYVTVNPGTSGGGMVTRIGSDCLLMMHVHVGHDCLIGDRVILVNSVNLGGHVVIGDHAVIGGASNVHQFCRIGEGAMIGGMSGIVADVIPYGTTTGERAHLAGLNLVGLKRRGLDKAAVNELRAAYGALFEGEGTLAERIRAVEERHGANPLIRTILDFLAETGARRITTPR